LVKYGKNHCFLVVLLVVFPTALLTAGGDDYGQVAGIEVPLGISFGEPPDLNILDNPGTGNGPIRLDGRIAENEYSHRVEQVGLQMYYNWNPESLDVGLRAPTSGWIALGLGSVQIEEAYLFQVLIRNGRAVLIESSGPYWRHVQTRDSWSLAHGLTLTVGEIPVITLELRVPRDLLILGQVVNDGYPFILLYGNDPDDTDTYTWRTSALLTRP